MHKARQIKSKKRFLLELLCAIVLTMTFIIFGCSFMAGKNTSDSTGKNIWVMSGFKDFSQGSFEDGGCNLYVNANGDIETIHRFDVNNDGYVDLVLVNDHDYGERGPTHVYTLSKAGKKDWQRLQLPNDSGWLSRILDVDKDDLNDLIVVNANIGVTAELPSYIYWGSSKGIGAERTDLPTVGAYDVVVVDINHDSYLDLIFPSAFKEHHDLESGKPLLACVYLGGKDRKFHNATEKYGIKGFTAKAIAVSDLNQDGYYDIVLANTASENDSPVESFIYWGVKDGINSEIPTRLPVGSSQVIVVDMNNDSLDDIVFSGGGNTEIYWNKNRTFTTDNRQVIEVSGYLDITDMDGDGHNELVIAAKEGVQIRSGTDFEKVQTSLKLTNTSWVTTCDLDGDGRKDIIVSRRNDRESYDCESPVYWNGPAGFSEERATWFPTGGAMGNTAGDLNGDGRPEVVYCNTMSGHCIGVPKYIYLGNKDANYGIENRLELPIFGGPVCTVADLDMDGYPEFVIAGTRIYSGGPYGPTTDSFVDLPAGGRIVDVTDFNLDGYLDVFCTFGIYYGSKEGFSNARYEAIKSDVTHGSFADVNKDGYLDIILTDKRKQVLIFLGGKDGYSKEHTWIISCPGLYNVGGTVNCADLNKDGWLDLIITTSGHYVRSKDTLYIYYGSEKGYHPENSQRYLGGYSPITTAVADYNGDGNLDVLVTAYASPTARVLPAQLFWGNGKTIDLEHPFDLPAIGSADALQVDLNRDGWIDLFLVCHRNDIHHKVNSLIYWNGPEGFSTDKVTEYWDNPKGFSTTKVTGLPGLGPHGMYRRDHGNIYTREPQESYISPPFDMKNRSAARIHWKAEVPSPTELKFQLRWAATMDQLIQAVWMGPGGKDTYYDQSGEQVYISTSDARWLQYRATFVSPYGCRSPKLREVRVILKEK